jgi:uncharacterized protein
MPRAERAGALSAGAGRLRPGGLLPVSLSAALLLWSWSCPIQAAEVVFPKARLELALADGARVDFSVELATTPAQTSRGLMFRESLPPGTGMLFDFGAATYVSMWMKNTPLSLDMVFADGQGLVVHVVEHTEPYSTASIPSPVPARYVLEIPAGTAQRLGIGLGARLLSLVPLE